MNKNRFILIVTVILISILAACKSENSDISSSLNLNLTYSLVSFDLNSIAEDTEFYILIT